VHNGNAHPEGQACWLALLLDNLKTQVLTQVFQIWTGDFLGYRHGKLTNLFPWFIELQSGVLCLQKCLHYTDD